MACVKSHMRHCWLFELDKGSISDVAGCSMLEVYGKDAIDDSKSLKCREGDKIY